MIIATAGHVDHGKSTLVRSLTGIDPDRWEEERRRGLTIDLGFGWTVLPTPDGAAPIVAAFVDVPGHRGFLANMLAGCGAVDVALLAVSAREGWMPQTEEHVQILSLLGVDHGVIALTHADLVDPDVLEAVAATLADQVRGTGFEQAAIVATSDGDPDSIGELAVALGAAAGRAAASQKGEATTARPRLWIDRSFSLPGSGRVVTGTLAGGPLVAGTTLDLQRGAVAEPVRLRGLHVNGEAQGEAPIGSRVGIDITGTGTGTTPQRGDALVQHDQWLSGPRWQVALEPVRGRRRPIAARGGYRIFVGTAHATAQLRYAQGELELAAGRGDGDPVLGRLYLEAPVGPVSLGDRVIIRDDGRDATVGAATILAADVHEVRYQRASLVERWMALAVGGRAPVGVPLTVGGRAALATVLVRQAGGALTTEELVAQVGPGLPRSPIELGGTRPADPSNEVGEHDQLAELGGWTVGRTAARARAAILLHELDARRSDAVPTDDLGVAVAAELVLRGLLERRGDLISLPGRGGYEAELAVALRAVEGVVAVHAVGLVTRRELAEAAQVGGRPVNELVNQQLLVGFDDLVTTVERWAEMVAVVERVLDQGPATVSELRLALGVSRRYAVPMLEHLDAEGITIREGDRRRWGAG